MMYTEVDELDGRINQMRKVLIQIAEETGLNSHDTLCYSQKLDELITIHQKLKIDNIQKVDQKSCIVI
ncbi:Spo0E family sporulation regulatory protein-aspartic acid phosphatase [Peribacillus sp. NPDC096379]|uniref:Spo0E family sporulation regulatory protein-aspartic acid phosphatase n=1 Tax=Peribacillus sp. NPDC096379 TaxID=3364393 RepID=UPI0037F62F74